MNFKLEEAVEVNCIGLPKNKYRIMSNNRISLSLVYPARPENFHDYTLILIHNEKTKSWEPHGLVDYYQPCPICGKFMHVLAIAGTTWLACCSKKCTKKYMSKHKKIFPGYEK